ncbi:MAG: efflux RND transporter periplasmic adaptor subunit [Spirochaetes bacterium]|nr:MAG: efflux RND transporter periplasmic adaptor subunit [Spirochaetota bacterium]
MEISIMGIMKVHRRKVALVLLVAGVCGATAVCFREEVRVYLGNGAGPRDGVSAPEIEIIKAERKDVTLEIELLGTVSYRDKASVSSRITGRVEEIFAEQGDRVEKGQELARIELLPLELELKSATAELKSSEAALRLAREKEERAAREVERHLRAISRARVDLNDKFVSWKNADSVVRKKGELFRAGAVTEMELDALKAGWTTAQAKYLAAKKEYEILSVGYRDEDVRKAGYEIPGDERARTALLTKLNTRLEAAETDAAQSAMNRAETGVEIISVHINEAHIRAPIAGVVAVRAVEKGERVRDDTPLFVVMNLAETYVIAGVGEKEAGKITKGLEARFTVDALPGEKFRGEVRLVSPVLDAGSRTVEVRLLADNARGMLKPGMFARVTVAAERARDVLLLPREALGDMRDGACEAYLFREGSLHRVTVKTGREFGDEIEVLSGVDEGDLVARGGSRRYSDGMKARVAREG